MSEGPEWFAPKRYGYGAGTPISWQGWVVTLIFMSVTIGLCFWLVGNPVTLIGAGGPLTIVFSIIAAKTTRGGFRWRWGSDD